MQQHRRGLRRRRLNAQRRTAGAHGPSRAHVPVFECGTVWSPLAEGPFFNGTLVPRIQLAILKTSKIMSWPRLARPRDLVGSLVCRGDDRATEISRCRDLSGRHPGCLNGTFPIRTALRRGNFELNASASKALRVPCPHEEPEYTPGCPCGRLRVPVHQGQGVELNGCPACGVS